MKSANVGGDDAWVEAHLFVPSRFATRERSFEITTSMLLMMVTMTMMAVTSTCLVRQVVYRDVLAGVCATIHLTLSLLPIETTKTGEKIYTKIIDVIRVAFISLSRVCALLPAVLGCLNIRRNRRRAAFELERQRHQVNVGQRYSKPLQTEPSARRTAQQQQKQRTKRHQKKNRCDRRIVRNFIRQRSDLC